MAVPVSQDNILQHFAENHSIAEATLVRRGRHYKAKGLITYEPDENNHLLDRFQWRGGAVPSYTLPSCTCMRISARYVHKYGNAWNLTI